MILKYLTELSKNRVLVLALFLGPVLFGIFLSDYQVALVDESPYVTYSVEFKASGMLSTDIERKVTEKAEKIFNGIPGLLFQESYTYNESSKVSLRFRPHENAENAALFIQEKIDRLKVVLPSEVESIFVKKEEAPFEYDMVVKTPTSLAFHAFKKLIGKSAVPVTTSNLESYKSPSIAIKLLTYKMLENKIGLDTVWKVLKLNSFSYNLGKKNDVMYFVDGNFKTLESVKRILVGKISERPIYLGDVADIELSPENFPSEVTLQINQKEMGSVTLMLWGIKHLKDFDYRLPRLDQIIKVSLFALLILALIICFQMGLGKIVFKNGFAQLSYLVLDAMMIGHFIFWCALLKKSFTWLDLEAAFFTLGVGTFFWTMLLARIRSYFFKSELRTFIQRNLEQAILFSLSELLPLFFILGLFLVLLNFPLLLGDINQVSTYIIGKVLFLGLPICLLSVTVVSLFSPLSWITSFEDNMKFQKTSENFSILNSIKGGGSRYWGILVFLMAMGSIVVLHFSPLQVETKQKSLISSSLDVFRGHEKLPTFLAMNPGEESKGNIQVDGDKSLLYGSYLNWIITPNGMGLLPQLDIHSFKNSLLDTIKKTSFGHFEFGNFFKGPVILSLGDGNFDGDDLGLLGPRHDKLNETIPLDRISKKEYVENPTRIYRVQLSRADEYVKRDTRNHVVNLNGGLENTPTPITIFLNVEWNKFQRTLIFALFIAFILLSVFLNSFMRGGLVLLISLSPQCLYMIIRGFFLRGFNLDELWLFSIPIWIFTASLLIFSRPMDIERARGNEREKVVSEAISRYRWPLLGGLFCFGFILLIKSLLGVMVSGSFPTIGQEGIFLGLYIAISAPLLIGPFFILYYLRAENIVEGLLIEIMKRYYRQRKK